MMDVRLFCSDLDGTLLGKPDATADFAATWAAIPEDKRPLLVYSTGRVVKDAERMIEKCGLPPEDFLIGGVGTAIFNRKKGELLREFELVLDEHWDREMVERIVLRTTPAERQPEHNQTELKCSWYWKDAGREDLAGLEAALAEAGIHAQLVYSSGRDLDVLPRFANKGNALEWLCQRQGIELTQVVVAGDTGNDATMFLVKGVRGIIPENAEPELLDATLEVEAYNAAGTCAEGVLEGLKHYGVIDRITVGRGAPGAGHDPAIRGLFVEESLGDGGAEMEEEIREGYERAIDGLRRCITPKGFSACSIADNEARGTDENYNSVWGRDGCLAVIGSLGLADDAFRQCQRETLVTLITHLSTTGQVPANVHIASGKPDYSGVGGIAAIDSGLWLMVAFHEYARVTRDFSLLREYRSELQAVMSWLWAHDSNMDGLLEIPEASDWMDLFNRSYNVLVDEVIWYRANIAYARILEMLGDPQGASRFFVRAEQVKRAINRTFWPSTRSLPEETLHGFTKVQKALGDTSYYLAQVSPFSFDWRCDVFGNILAFLYNVADFDRAKTAFRFMWGVGVNEPLPVRNLYPPVHAGDPDWRPYYTVNLLNLPNHYHNGGIWPFIGGMWVRFILRLGLREVALKELHQLARLNRRGVLAEWEFNEWYHAGTGRPMGKSYQAWSCSEYIRTYHEAMETR